MTTINELAENYGHEHQGTVDIEIFKDGAMSVMREIKRFLKHYRSYPNSGLVMRGDLNMFLKELQK